MKVEHDNSFRPITLTIQNANELCVFKSLFAALSQYTVNKIAGGILDESFNCNKVFEELHAAYPNVLIVDLDISFNN